MSQNEDKFFDGKGEKKEKSLRRFDLLSAPGLGGDFKSRGMTYSNDDLVADFGRYSTDKGRNYYGYLGVTPMNIGNLQLGGALGAYGPNIRDMGMLAGLLMQYPIVNGQMRGLLSPSINGSGPSFFLGYEKRF